MKKLIFLASLAISTASFATGKPDEHFTVVGQDLSGPDPVGGNPVGGGGGRGTGSGTGGGTGGGGRGFSPLVKYGCQECQSDSAFYKCGVAVGITFGEDPLKTLQKLQGQNCCAAKGGRVLSTKAEGC